jgi:probable phosphoglycerate mutase
VPGEIVLVRHGQTEWSQTGQHTSHTDIPLTDHGREQARSLAAAVGGRSFALVLSSPLVRAHETCSLAGLGDAASIDEDLMEWDYGEYEGLTTPEIRETRRDWWLWTDGCPDGETPEQVAARADRVIARLREAVGDGDAICFAHGHILRVIGARWTGMDVGFGARLALAPASVSALGYERETEVIAQWNRLP